MTRFIHLHGFCSSPSGSKTVFFKERFDSLAIELITPDLNLPSFFDLTIERQVDTVKQLVASEDTPVTLMGSSMGALVALLSAESSHLVQKLVLLAPALVLTLGMKEQLGDEFIRKWQQEGRTQFFHYGTDRFEEISSSLYSELAEIDCFALERSIPTLLIQGLNDDLCPPEPARRFAATRPAVKLVELDTDHLMHDRLAEIWQLVAGFVTA